MKSFLIRRVGEKPISGFLDGFTIENFPPATQPLLRGQVTSVDIDVQDALYFIGHGHGGYFDVLPMPVNQFGEELQWRS